MSGRPNTTGNITGEKHVRQYSRAPVVGLTSAGGGSLLPPRSSSKSPALARSAVTIDQSERIKTKHHDASSATAPLLDYCVIPVDKLDFAQRSDFAITYEWIFA